jgi:hypothetical protein
MESAVDQYAIETNRKTGEPFGWNDLKPYIKKDSRLYNAFSATDKAVRRWLIETKLLCTGFASSPVAPPARERFRSRSPRRPKEDRQILRSRQAMREC